nr:DUF2842 domain-containing protein [Novosphingobium sp.]
MMNEPPPPTWRKPAGILMLLTGLVLYGVLVASASGLIAQTPVLVQAVVYMVLGIVWILPLRRFLIWMETGRFG